MLRKVLIAVAVVILVVLVGGGAFVASRQHLRFDPPTLTSRLDGLGRGGTGRYIVRDVAPCAACHGDPSQRAAYAGGAGTH